MANLGYRVQFVPRPWKRCLKEAETGKSDAIVSASYRQERAEYLFYPKDVPFETKSKWRIMNAEYVVITSLPSDYQFDGDVTGIPVPVRAPLGYSIIDDLKRKGVGVISSPSIIACLKQLLQSGRGAVLTVLQNAESLTDSPLFRGKFMIHSTPIQSKSYFIVFSQVNKKLKPTEIQAIWGEVARLREDKSYMEELFKKY